MTVHAFDEFAWLQSDGIDISGSGVHDYKHYRMEKDVILRLEYMSQKQTKVKILTNCNLPTGSNVLNFDQDHSLFKMSFYSPIHMSEIVLSAGCRQCCSSCGLQRSLGLAYLSRSSCSSWLTYVPLPAFYA